MPRLVSMVLLLIQAGWSQPLYSVAYAGYVFQGSAPAGASPGGIVVLFVRGLTVSDVTATTLPLSATV